MWFAFEVDGSPLPVLPPKMCLAHRRIDPVEDCPPSAKLVVSNGAPLYAPHDPAAVVGFAVMTQCKCDDPVMRQSCCG